VSVPNRRQESAAGQAPLAGLRVLDFTTVMAGPYCTRVLSAMGAEVVKVESPDGDYTRGAEPLRGGRSGYFAELNNGKSGIMLDLKQPRGLRAAAALACRADVIVENFRPGVMARLGLDYPTLSGGRPDLVYCSISGYGQDGPWTQRPATAQAIHATVGYDLAFAAYQQGAAAPPATGLFVADGMAGALAVSGIMAALRLRDLTGLGRHVDVSLDRSLLSMLVYEVQTAQFDPGFVRKGYRPARTKDGFVMIAAVNKRNFEALSEVIGRPDLLTDPRFATTAPRWRAYDELHAIIEEWTTGHTSERCEATLLKAGVPVAQYRSVRDYLSDPGNRERILTRAADAAGLLDVTGLPFGLEPPPAAGQVPPAQAAPRHVPELGEDTRAVMTAWLGREVAGDLLGPDVGGRAIDSAAPLLA
jgi:crotonobetainyl-CoA:carnitine CoA-transferase CaiB-like acyl-CoA transferase